MSLFHLGERAYDHVLLLPPKSKAYGPALTPNILLDFINSDGNILLALSGDHPTPSGISSLLLEFDISIPSDRNALVVDHFNYDTKSAPEKHDVIVVSSPKQLRPDLRSFFETKQELAVPRAVGHTLGNANALLVPILRAPSTAYSYNPKDESEGMEDLFASGEQLALISALQARNSARFTVLGSAEMLQNEWFGASVKIPGRKDAKTSNREFAKQLSQWTFKELGVLKVQSLHHHLNDGTVYSGNESSFPLSELDPKIYRIKNDVTYTIEVSEYIEDHWAPFTPPGTDVLQLEFSMLSPFHRLPLSPISSTQNSTVYSVSFKLPDQHGIFNFRVNYKRPFLTTVDEKRQVTVRHFAHDEWPRSWEISGAWVWIAGIGVTAVGWVAFVAIWLWSRPEDEIKKTQ